MDGALSLCGSKNKAAGAILVAGVILDHFCDANRFSYLLNREVTLEHLIDRML